MRGLTRRQDLIKLIPKETKDELKEEGEKLVGFVEEDVKRFRMSFPASS
jgi:hypothetical protein